MSKFTHIQDTQFPHLDTVNVYKYKNEFDYKRWSDAGVIITLTSVPWGGTHHPHFDNEVAKIRYFEKKPATVQVQNASMSNKAPLNEINVNVPYDSCQEYNYLWIYFPQKTPIGGKIEEEKNANQRLERMFYFVKSFEQLAPNTTRCTLELDIWTTYYSQVQYDSILFERGHYASVNAPSVDTYLKNPWKNRKFLLTPDFNFGEIDTITHKKFEAISKSGGNAIVFVVSRDPVNFASMTGGTTSTNTAASYNSDNTLDYTGSFSWQGMDYKSASPITPSILAQNADTADGSKAFYIDPAHASTFFTNINDKYLQFYKYVLAVFVAPKNLLHVSATFTFAGVPCSRLQSGNAAYDTIREVAFTKENYKLNTNFAKAYTYPYSAIEAKGPDGQYFLIRPQNLGTSIKINTKLSAIWPWIQMQSFLEGLEGDQTANYTWQALDGTTKNKSLPAAWTNYLSEYQIPTYMLQYSSINEAKLTGAGATNINRRNAIQAHNATVRNANLQYRTTQYNCDLASANTQIANNTQSSNTALGNSLNATTTSNNNTLATRNANTSIGVATANRDASNTFTGTVNDIENAALQQATNNSNMQSTVGGVVSAGTQIVGGFLSGGPVGLASGIAGAAGSLLGTAVSNHFNSAATNISVAKNTSVSNWTQRLTTTNTGTANWATETQNSDSVNNALNNSYAQQNYNYSTTANTNAANTQTTANANSTNLANSKNAQNNNIYLSKIALSNAQANNTDRLVSASFNVPPAAGRSSSQGLAGPDIFEQRGWEFTVKTQNSDAIAAIDKYWDRYGYAWQGIVSPGALNKLSLRNNYTFWKSAGDTWVIGDAPQNIKQWFSYAMEAGLTVWKNPDDAKSNSI